jgi:glutamyl-tRNA reductase
MMHILCLGVSFRTAPLELLEKLRVPPGEMAPVLARLGHSDNSQAPAFTELAILSTCNRTEIYAVLPDGQIDQAAAEEAGPFGLLLTSLAESGGLAAADLTPATYRLSGLLAVEHLCRVAAGLDSMVLGEPQILGQVSAALAQAQAHNSAGPVLSGLFRTALHAGKRARSETGIGRNAASMSSVAVKLAASTVPQLAAARVLVLGAGQMAELAVEALRARGVAQITVMNRSLERAAALAGRWLARPDTFDGLAAALSEADVVISSTDAPNYLVSAEAVLASMVDRPDRPLVFIDIANPRDIDPAVAQVPGVSCYDLSDLQNIVSDSLAERGQHVPLVDTIVADEAACFQAWLYSLDVAPLIGQLHAHADKIRQAEVARTLQRMPQLTTRERLHIEALAEALVRKLLHEPTCRLKSEASNGRGDQAADAARRLFGLND